MRGGGGTGNAHAVNDVASEAERHQLGSGEKAALLEGHPEVYVDQLGPPLVDQDVLQVAVSQPYYVTLLPLPKAP
jgi:hypothetical protein